MKKLRRLAALFMAVIMVMGTCITSFADDEPTYYTFTISGDSTNIYDAYQIFDGVLATVNGSEVLSSITWGSGVDTTKTVEGLTLMEAIQEVEAFSTCTTAAEVAAILGNNISYDNGNAVAFAEVVANYLSSTFTSSVIDSTANPKTNTITVDDAGYYLIKNQDGSLVDTNYSYSRYMLVTTSASGVTATVKSDSPEVVKKVEETDDTDDSTTWQDAADYDIGDSINYRLTAVLPSTLSDYEKYSITFTDTLSKGLTLPVDNGEITGVEVRVFTSRSAVTNATEEGIIVNASHYSVSSDDYTGSDTDYEGGTVLQVEFEDILNLTDENGNPITVSDEYAIVVYYSVTLNEDAAIGSAGNPNKVDLTFSNNPYDSGTGKTPEDMVTVFTFDLDVNKVDGGGNKLEGAAFALLKKVTSVDDLTEDTGDYTVGNYITETNGTDTIYWLIVGFEDSGSTFTFDGLDSGNYKLIETVVPAGYNKADDLEFRIGAEYDTHADDPGLTKLVIYDTSGKKLASTTSGEVENPTFTVSITGSTDGKIGTNVINNAGSSLPSTGGIGTTIFYLVGGILAGGAALLLIVKKRMETSE